MYYPFDKEKKSEKRPENLVMFFGSDENKEIILDFDLDEIKNKFPQFKNSTGEKDSDLYLFLESVVKSVFVAKVKMKR